MSFPTYPPGFFDDDRFLVYMLPCIALLALAALAIVLLIVAAWRTLRAGTAALRDVVWPRAMAAIELRVAVANFRDQFHLPLIFYGLAYLLQYLWPPNIWQTGRWLPQAILLWLFVFSRGLLFWDRIAHRATQLHTKSYLLGFVVLALLMVATVGFGLVLIVVTWPFWFAWLGVVGQML